jgi:hypothetical protein
MSSTSGHPASELAVIVIRAGSAHEGGADEAAPTKAKPTTAVPTAAVPHGGAKQPTMALRTTATMLALR